MQRSTHPDDQDRRYIGFLITDVGRLMRASFDRRVRRIGLTRAQWQVLNLLHRRPGASQTELAEMLEVERATAGRMVDRLERKNWVERRADAADRRINRLYLTEEAAAIQAEMRRIGEDLLEDALAPLAGDEREALVDMMERVKGRLQSMGARNGTRADASLEARA
jgi:DNA-binding MarR family transcriptional regulator